MDFEIKITITAEYPIGTIQSDLVSLDQLIREMVQGKHYGASVTKYFWGFELFRFKGGFATFFNNDVESWKYSTKWLVTNSRFDWDIFKDLAEGERLKLIKEELPNSIGRIQEMKRKPKDFDYLRFRTDMIDILKHI